MNAKTTYELAEEFICNYLKELRYLSSVIPERDRGPFLPNCPHWYRPAKITIYTTPLNDLAISIDDIVKGKEDRIRLRGTYSRIEETHFPHLDYSKSPMFRIPEYGHHIIILGGILDPGTHPIIILGKGAEMRFLWTRIESNVKGYPRERHLLWFLKSPNERYLNTERAISGAKIDFFELFQTNAWDTFSSRLELDNIEILFDLASLYHKFELFNAGMKLESLGGELSSVIERNPKFLDKLEEDLKTIIQGLDSLRI